VFVDIEALLKQSPREIRRQCGIPHPLSNFAASGIEDAWCADLLLEYIRDCVFEDAGSMTHESARWLLLESDMFFSLCSRAGINGERFRTHLLKVEAGEFEEED
jgi:hypothetical protein